METRLRRIGFPCRIELAASLRTAASVQITIYSKKGKQNPAFLQGTTKLMPLNAVKEA